MDPRILLAAVGAAQGVAVWLLTESWPDAHAARAASIGLLTFVAVSAAALHFAWTGGHAARLLGLAAATGITYGLVATWVGLTTPEEGSVALAGDHRPATWTFASLVTLYVLGPFLQIYQRTGRRVFAYEDLFLHAWNNFFVALVGALFKGALWTVLLLWAELFDLIGIDFFSDLFGEKLFVCLATGAALGFGIALGRESERVVATLRTITLKVFAGLLPLVCGVALLFLAALPVTGLEPLWRTDRASLLLMAWVAVAVLFFNAVYQDGERAEPLAPALRRLVEAGLVGTTGFLAVAAWGLWLRIDQYGLTPSRVWASLLWVVLTAYALGYAGAVLWRGRPWLPAVRPVNRAVAWLVIALGLLAHTPVLDPLGWSARSQYERLREGRVPAAEFDYGYLRFQLGRAGAERFERIAKWRRHAEIEAVRAGVAHALAVDGYWTWRQEREPTRRDVAAIEELARDAQAPHALVAAIARAPSLLAESCASGGCLLFSAELTSGPPEEWVLASGVSGWSSLHVFRQDGDRFAYEGTLETRDAAARARSIDSAIRERRFEAVPSLHRDLLLGGARYELRPPR